MKHYSNIRSINDLNRQKRLLESKIKIRNRLLNKHFNDLNDDFSAQYVFRETARALKIDNPAIKFLSAFFKGQKLNKKFYIPIITGLATAIASFFLFNSNKRTPVKNKEE